MRIEKTLTRIRPKILLFFILLFVVVYATHSQAVWATTSIREMFLQKSQLREAAAKLIKGPSACQEGKLSFLDLGEELTLMLGAEPLGMGFGKSAGHYQEDNCHYVEFNWIEIGKVTWTQRQKCTINEDQEEIVDRKIVVTARDDGFSYVRTNLANGHLTTITCKYKYTE